MKAIRFILLFLVASSFTLLPEKPRKLGYQFAVGTNYQLSENTVKTVKQSIPGAGDVNIDITIEGVLNLKIVELTATGAKIEAIYSKIKTSTKSPMIGEILMDSEGPQDNSQNKAVKSILEKPFFIFISKTGSVEKLENTNNLYSGLSGIGLDEAGLAAAKQTLEQSLGEKNISATIQLALTSYSDLSVKVGDTWKKTTNSEIGIPLQTENVWTFTKVEGQIGYLDSEGTIVTPDKEKVISLNGMKAKADLTGRQMVKTIVDVKTGWPSEVKTISETKGNITLFAGGMIPEDMQIPMEGTSESTFTFVKK